MGNFGGFYSGEKKKKKKAVLEERSRKEMLKRSYTLPKVEILGKEKNRAS